MMMTPDKNMDALFRQLHNIEAEPPPHVWQGVEGRLNQKKRRVVPLILRWGMAASLLAAAAVFWFIDAEFTAENNQTARSENSLEKQDGSSRKVFSTYNGFPENKSIAAVEIDSFVSAPSQVIAVALDEHEKYAVPVENTMLVGNNSENAPSGLLLTASKDSDEQMFQKLDGRPVGDNLFTENKPDAPELVHQIDGIEISDHFPLPVSSEKKAKPLRLTVGGEYSPTYAFRGVSGSVPSRNSESGLITSGGGFSMAIRVNSRWQVETGVKYAMLGQQVVADVSPEQSYRVYALSAENGVNVKEVPLSNSLGVINSNTSPAPASDARAFQSAGNELIELQADMKDVRENPLLEQNFSYVKIPFTLRYKVFSLNRLDLFLSGGISTNWLVDNNAYLHISGQKQRIGETDGLARMGFSTHAGVAVAIPVFGRLHLRMEPRVDYFISDVSEGSPVSFKPYSVGVFTGVFYTW
jgi:hypothetical protein